MIDIFICDSIVIRDNYLLSMNAIFLNINTVAIEEYGLFIYFFKQDISQLQNSVLMYLSNTAGKWA